MATPSALSQLRTNTASQLHPARRSIYLRGFGNLLRNELRRWWGTHAWWMHLLVWLFIINGFIALIGWAATQDTEGAAPPVDQLTGPLLFQLSLIGTSIGAIITAQGSIIGEKQLGTAGWVLSKPVSRSAFILAKLVAHTLGYVVLAVGIPGVVFYGQMALQWDRVPSLVPFLLGNLLTVVNLMFYLALTLMLGTLFTKRGPVAGVALGFLLLGSFMRSLFPALMQVMPWALPDLAGAIAAGQPLPPSASLPIVGTVVLTIVFIAAAFWRFNREEF
jgi:ABC-2 type transport system permease protein